MRKDANAARGWLRGTSGPFVDAFHTKKVEAALCAAGRKRSARPRRCRCRSGPSAQGEAGRQSRRPGVLRPDPLSGRATSNWFRAVVEQARMPPAIRSSPSRTATGPPVHDAVSPHGRVRACSRVAFPGPWVAPCQPTRMPHTGLSARGTAGVSSATRGRGIT